jgi:hypothetical protein
MKYYGVRYARKCDPSQLMKTYFTSSKYVKKYIEENGLPDIVQIRKTFGVDRQAAELWEFKVLHKLNASKRKDYLNMTNGTKASISWNTEVSNKMSSYLSKRNKENWKNPEYREKMLDVLLSEETIDKCRRGASISVSKRNKENWKNSEYREHMANKLSKSTKEMWKNSEYRNNQIIRSKELWKNQEYRQKISETKSKNPNSFKNGGIATGKIRKKCPSCDFVSTPAGIGNHKKGCELFKASQFPKI